MTHHLVDEGCVVGVTHWEVCEAVQVLLDPRFGGRPIVKFPWHALVHEIPHLRVITVAQVGTALEIHVEQILRHDVVVVPCTYQVQALTVARLGNQPQHDLIRQACCTGMQTMTPEA